MVLEFSIYKNYNSFKFLISLLKIKKFKLFLDPKSIHQKGMFLDYV